MDKEILLAILLNYYEYIKHGDAEHQAWLYNATLEFHKNIDLTQYNLNSSINTHVDKLV